MSLEERETRHFCFVSSNFWESFPGVGEEPSLTFVYSFPLASTFRADEHEETRLDSRPTRRPFGSGGDDEHFRARSTSFSLSLFRLPSPSRFLYLARTSLPTLHLIDFHWSCWLSSIVVVEESCEGERRERKGRVRTWTRPLSVRTV